MAGFVSNKFFCSNKNVSKSIFLKKKIQLGQIKFFFQNYVSENQAFEKSNKNKSCLKHSFENKNMFGNSVFEKSNFFKIQKTIFLKKMT